VASRRWLTDYRLGDQDIIGRSHYDVFPEISDQWREVHRRCLAGAVKKAEEDAFPRADGTTDWVRWEIRPWRDHTGAVGGLLLFSELITERKKAEEALRARESKFRALLESSLDGIVIVDHTGRIAIVNDATEKLFGYKRDELLGQPPELLMPERFRAGHIGHRMDYSSHPRSRPMGSGLEVYGRRKDGTEMPLEISLSPLKTEEGLLVTGIIRDITERKRLEAQFLQSQKMEAVGRLAGGVAHDFNNLLTIITGYSQLLLGQLGANEPFRAQLEEITKAGDRAASLTRQLLAFSRRQVIAPQLLDLNTVVANTDKMLRRLIGEDIELVRVPGKELRKVRADPGQIEQVIVNLAVNARDAMPQGGRLTLETENVELDEAYAHTHLPVIPAPYVLLAVSDTGIGMDSEVQSHCFEPFFTTKEPGKGTGLGLATVYGIVKQSGGYVWVYSEPGRGTTVKIYLPGVETSAETVERPAESASRLQGSETVLLVEDEEAVRRLARGILETKGYSVLEANGGEEALQLCWEHQGPIHIMLTDVVMPGLSGRELAERLAALRPELKVLYMSGYTDDAVVRHGILAAGTAFLQKPFAPDALARKVREILDK